jgi:hypothetical protein
MASPADPKSTEERIIELLEKQSEKDDVPVHIAWLDSFLPAVIGIATFGGSITFSLVPATPRASATFAEDEITLFLALTWFFFLLALGYASAASLVLAFHRKEITAYINRPATPNGNSSSSEPTSANERLAIIFVARAPISLIIQLLILLAFIFLGLVVVAYSKVVGILAVAFTGLFTLFAIFMWAAQNGWLKCRKKNKSNHVTASPTPSFQGSDEEIRHGSAWIAWHIKLVCGEERQEYESRET